jgi:hypothetical protein
MANAMWSGVTGATLRNRVTVVNICVENRSFLSRSGVWAAVTASSGPAMRNANLGSTAKRAINR